jgi:hypothetical protein
MEYHRRTRPARHLVCRVCGEPARPCPPDRWCSANGPRPRWSHMDGQPLCPTPGTAGCRPMRPRLVPVAPLRRTRRRPVTGAGAAGGSDRAPRTGGGVYVVAGGDLVAVFADRDSARIQFEVMTGANLEPIIDRLTAPEWEAARTRLRQHPEITITDTRPGHHDRL